MAYRGPIEDPFEKGNVMTQRQARTRAKRRRHLKHQELPLTLVTHTKEPWYKRLIDKIGGGA